jgi:hypothetical protein
MRILIALAALATSATLFAGSATTAFAATPGYRLVPETAISGNSVVARDVLWKRSGDAWIATKATSRAEIVCSSAAREIGKISSFSANGTDFTSDQLAKCNEKAR